MEEKVPQKRPRISKGKDKDNRSKRKLGENVTYDDLIKDWTQCCFLIHHKQRLCNMSRVPNSSYCGNHLFLTEDNLKIDGTEGDSHARIRCPLDPNHTIFARNLEAHVKKCNAKKYQDTLLSLPYYQENCNGGVDFGIDQCTNENNFSDDVDLMKLVAKVHKVFESVEVLPLKDLEVSELQSKIDTAIRASLGKEQTSFKQTRHTDQDVAIVHQLIRFQLLTTDNFLNPLKYSNSENSASHPRGENCDVFLEFGAGKGLLGLAVHVCDPLAYLVFIERSSNRKKVDKILNDQNFVLFDRVRMDIRHCHVPSLPCVSSPADDTKHCTIVAKHLCGVASDLAIRSLSHYSKRLSRMRGVGIATCCHHACNFRDYVGHQWLEEQDISLQEFDILKYWSAWATVDRTVDYRKPKYSADNLEDQIDGERDHEIPIVAETIRPRSLTHEEMLDVGRKVKRIFDFGRVKYIREVLNMDAQLVHYCDPKLSPECVMIVAKEKGDNT